MNKADKEETVELLKDDGFILGKPLNTEGRGVDAREFEEAISKLVKNYHQLTKSETDVVVALAKRF